MEIVESCVDVFVNHVKHYVNVIAVNIDEKNVPKLVFIAIRPRVEVVETDENVIGASARVLPECICGQC